jgi:hypothetical protein
MKAAMLVLEIVILFLASAGAIYGIWSGDRVNKTTATISTVITLCGVGASVGLSILKTFEDAAKAAEAEERRTDELITTLAATELRELEVVWTLRNVPPPVLKVFDIGEIIDDTYFLRNEDVDRLPRESQAVVAMAEHIDSTLEPLIGMIAAGRTDTTDLFDGEDVETAIARYKTDRDAWVEGVGTSIGYKGPNYDLLFPLNPRSTAFLSLGKVRDDVASQTPNLWQEDTGLFDRTNFGFSARAERDGSTVKLVWSYSQASLGRATERISDAGLTGGLGKAFSFIVVHQDLDRSRYVSDLTKSLNGGDVSAEPANPENWTSRSTLEVFVNGLRSPHYVYEVTHAGTQSYAPDIGAYDAPVEEFPYTRFDCRLSRLD